MVQIGGILGHDMRQNSLFPAISRTVKLIMRTTEMLVELVDTCLTQPAGP